MSGSHLAQPQAQNKASFKDKSSCLQHYEGYSYLG